MTQPGPTLSEQLRDKSWDGALHAFATSAIFSRRSNALDRRLKLLNFSTLAPPVAVGGIALAGIKDQGWFLLIMSVVTVPIAIASLWAVIAAWQKSEAAAVQSEVANLEIHDEYLALAERPPTDEAEFQRRFDLVATRDQAQRNRDLGENVAGREKRFGMRAALRQRGKKCVDCNLVPTSMKPTKCGVCGDFPKRWQR
ncbi:mobilome CxxCx(11)CxxC protein [Nocardia bovistercoris]|uniref:Uncharacterized protein n=1 Tax=Nocardia bovistercoris TaxID=2785916 RepID=A0A931IIU0_9NOCA|nr:mobilome CxxCx(11)CxxC protein [Nocardia bovistercoris]MBH0780393.1 hypothetical protein [Nocardia bovistercoris]